MSDTIRELIIKKFVSWLPAITIANGYSTAIGGNILRARKTVDPDELPMSNIIPGTETGELKYGMQKCTMTIRIEAIVHYGSVDPSVMSEKILGDLKKCVLAPDNLTSTPKIDSIIYTGGGTDEYPDDGKKTIGAYANFDVQYATKIYDPCEQ